MNNPQKVEYDQNDYIFLSREDPMNQIVQKCYQLSSKGEDEEQYEFVLDKNDIKQDFTNSDIKEHCQKEQDFILINTKEFNLQEQDDNVSDVQGLNQKVQDFTVNTKNEHNQIYEESKQNLCKNEEFSKIVSQNTPLNPKEQDQNNHNKEIIMHEEQKPYQRILTLEKQTIQLNKLEDINENDLKDDKIIQLMDRMAEDRIKDSQKKENKIFIYLFILLLVFYIHCFILNLF